jgi:hypothetical protein
VLDSVSRWRGGVDGGSSERRGEPQPTRGRRALTGPSDRRRKQSSSTSNMFSLCSASSRRLCSRHTYCSTLSSLNSTRLPEAKSEARPPGARSTAALRAPGADGACLEFAISESKQKGPSGLGRGRRQRLRRCAHRTCGDKPARCTRPPAAVLSGALPCPPPIHPRSPLSIVLLPRRLPPIAIQHGPHPWCTRLPQVFSHHHRYVHKAPRASDPLLTIRPPSQPRSPPSRTAGATRSPTLSSSRRT